MREPYRDWNGLVVDPDEPVIEEPKNVTPPSGGAYRRARGGPFDVALAKREAGRQGTTALGMGILAAAVGIVAVAVMALDVVSGIMLACAAAGCAIKALGHAGHAIVAADKFVD